MRERRYVDVGTVLSILLSLLSTVAAHGSDHASGHASASATDPTGMIPTAAVVALGISAGGAALYLWYRRQGSDGTTD